LAIYTSTSGDDLKVARFNSNCPSEECEKSEEKLGGMDALSSGPLIKPNSEMYTLKANTTLFNVINATLQRQRL
jgi:hypothetical protein